MSESGFTGIISALTFLAPLSLAERPRVYEPTEEDVENVRLGMEELGGHSSEEEEEDEQTESGIHTKDKDGGMQVDNDEDNTAAVDVDITNDEEEEEEEEMEEEEEIDAEGDPYIVIPEGVRIPSHIPTLIILTTQNRQKKIQTQKKISQSYPPTLSYS